MCGDDGCQLLGDNLCTLQSNPSFVPPPLRSSLMNQPTIIPHFHSKISSDDWTQCCTDFDRVQRLKHSKRKVSTHVFEWCRTHLRTALTRHFRKAIHKNQISIADLLLSFHQAVIAGIHLHLSYPL